MNTLTNEYSNIRLIRFSTNYDAATDVGMLGKMCRSSAPCLCTLLASVPFLFVCFVGLYAGHPYIHLISFEIFLLALCITLGPGFCPFKRGCLLFRGYKCRLDAPQGN